MAPRGSAGRDRNPSFSSHRERSQLSIWIDTSRHADHPDPPQRGARRTGTEIEHWPEKTHLRVTGRNNRAKACPNAASSNTESWHARRRDGHDDRANPLQESLPPVVIDAFADAWHRPASMLLSNHDPLDIQIRVVAACRGF